MPVIEGTRIEPDKRNGLVATRIMREVEKRYLEFGKAVAMAFTENDKPEVGEYLERLGFEHMPLTFYKKDLISAEKGAA
jgi:N-acetylglutamate synthase-like GNAT family acetyltransferase